MKPSRFAALTSVAALGLAVSQAAAQGFASPFLSAPDVLGGEVSSFITALAPDLDGDGLPELVTHADTDDAGVTGVLVCANQGGSLAAPVLHFVPVNVLGARLYVADMDLDGAIDVLSSHGAQMFLLRGLGDGTLAPYELAGMLPPNAARFAAGDVNDDGLPDVAIGTAAIGSGNQLTLAAGLGDGTLLPAQTVAALPTSTGGFFTVNILDIDQDGHTDLLTQSGPFPVATSWFNVFRGTGGAFLPLAQLKAGGFQQELIVTQLDGDSLPELLVGKSTQSFLTIDVGAGGVLAQPVETPLGAKLDDLRAVDVDLDGWPDGVGKNFAQRLGVGAQPLGAPLALASPLTRAAWADFDGDSLPDVACPATQPWPMPILLQRNVLGPVIDLGYASPAGPTLQVTGEPVANAAVTLLVSGPTVGTPGFVVMGLHPAQLPLGGAVLVPAPDALLPVASGVPLKTRWPATLLPGTPLWLQGVIPAPAPAMSQALVVVP